MPRKEQYYVYILTNKNNRVLYIGVTNDLRRRMYEHQQSLVEGFSKRYNLNYVTLNLFQGLVFAYASP
jgi:putative endonuclease